MAKHWSVMVWRKAFVAGGTGAIIDDQQFMQQVPVRQCPTMKIGGSAITVSATRLPKTTFATTPDRN